MSAPENRAALLLEVGLALSAELSLPALLQRIVDLAVEVTQARYGALGVLAPGGGRIVDFITTGVTDLERAAIGPLPEGRGVLGVLIRDARPLRLDEIAADPRSVGFPPNHPPMHSFLGAPVLAHGEVFGNIYLTEKRDAEHFSADDQSALVILATQAGVAIANARLYEETRLRERWLDAVRETATAILTGAEPDGVLRLVARRARELVSADVATITVPDRDGTLRVRVADGEHDADLEGLEVPQQGSVTAAVMSSGTSVLLEDAMTAEGVWQPMPAKARVRPMIVVPLHAHGIALGALAVGNRSVADRFQPQSVGLLETFASQAALALEYGRTQRELRRLALVEDRERIAKDLHDGVIQSLFAVGLGLQGAATLVGDPRVEARITEAVVEIDHAVRDLRSYIFGLRPAVLQTGLTVAVDRMAHDFGSRSGIVTAADVDHSLEEELAGVANDVIQMVREALSNVARHSGARTCRVSLRRTAEGAVVEVDDDGVGLLPGGDGRGMGLENLRLRVAGAGGVLRIDSVPGEGTTVRATFPIG